MCATPDKATTEEFRKHKGPQWAYKVIQNTGKPDIHTELGFKYQPGHNVDPRAKRKSYQAYLRRASGLHCYLSRRDAVKYRKTWNDEATHAIVRVSFDPADVIAAEKPGSRRQVIVRALHISKRAWKRAGLPATKGGAS